MERRLSDRVTLICVRTVQPYALRVTGHHQKLNLKCLDARSRTSSYYRLMLLPLIPLPARFAATHTHQRLCRAASIKLQQSITSSVRQHVKDWLASLWILRRVKSLPQVSPKRAYCILHHSQLRWVGANKNVQNCPSSSYGHSWLMIAFNNRCQEKILNMSLKWIFARLYSLSQNFLICWMLLEHFS